MDLINYLKSKFITVNSSESAYIDPGEFIACRYLKKIGYVILEKNYRSRYGEIDIIAEDRESLCFVEVKSRKNTHYALPEEYVDKRKQKRLLKTSMIYLSDRGKSDIDRRFDVVLVDLNTSACRKINNAFDPDF